MQLNARPTASRMNIRSHQGNYCVDFLEDLRTARETLNAIPDPFILVDERVWNLRPSLFGGIDPARVHVACASENEKTLAGVEKVATFLMHGGASRSSTLVVVGGGIVQDIGAFAAHIYYRGIPYVHFPTTLLSMADSCIGAKCALNLGPYKNQVGFFQSPSRVAIVSEFLTTLPPTDIRSGFGEILKLAITAGVQEYAWFEARMEAAPFGRSWVNEAILLSLQTKRAVIEEDEYERSSRKTLNYGHTFGHALESVTDHEVPHGLAVAWGIDVANYIATLKGLLDAATYLRIHALLVNHFSFQVDHRYDAVLLLNAMKRDKKAGNGGVGLIFPEGFGRLTIVHTPIDDKLQEAIADYLQNGDICSMRP